MTGLGDEKRVMDYMTEADIGVTRPSFGMMFRGFPPAKFVQAQVDRYYMDAFFQFAEFFLRARAAGRAINKRDRVRDYERCRRLMQGTRDTLIKLQNYSRRFPQNGPSRTAPVARFILDETARLTEELNSTFEETINDMDDEESMLMEIQPKSAAKKYTDTVWSFISHQFPKMSLRGRRALLGAALAGAKLYTPEELGRNPMQRIPRKITMARRYFKDNYDSHGNRIKLPAWKAPNKKKQGQRRKRVLAL
jgi:hypothetical protein